MKDAIGNEIREGDHVVYGVSGYLRPGRILEIKDTIDQHYATVTISVMTVSSKRAFARDTTMRYGVDHWATGDARFWTLVKADIGQEDIDIIERRLHRK